MRKPFNRDGGGQAEPATVEATLIFKLPGRLVAMCRSGVLYTWLISSQRQADPWKEGDLVYVNFDQVTGTVFSMSKTGVSAASGGA